MMLTSPPLYRSTVILCFDGAEVISVVIFQLCGMRIRLLSIPSYRMPMKLLSQPSNHGPLVSSFDDTELTFVFIVLEVTLQTRN